MKKLTLTESEVKKVMQWFRAYRHKHEIDIDKEDMKLIDKIFLPSEKKVGEHKNLKK